MSYQFKKLSEVELLDAVPEGAKVLAEVDGEIRRVPSNGLDSAESAVVDIFPEQSLEGFSYNGLYGAYHKMLNPAPFTLTEGQEYIVVWDGEIFTETAFAYTYDDGSRCVAIGNTVFTGEDTGEPFCIVYDTTNSYIHFFATDDAESHTIRIYQGANSGNTIPGPPEFDLTAMGLPALTLDGNPVSVECDTTELEAALAKNVVKISCTLDIGMGVTWPITGIVNAFRCNGGYQCGFVANLDGLLFWCLDIYDGTITGRIINLATT